MEYDKAMEEMPLEQPHAATLMGKGSSPEEDMRTLLMQRQTQILELLAGQDKKLSQMMITLAKTHATRTGDRGSPVMLGEGAQELGPRKKPSMSFVPKSPDVFRTFQREDQQHREMAASKDGEVHRKRFATTHMNASDAPSTSWSQRLVDWPGFDIFFALVVVTNSIFIGLEVQHSINPEDQGTAVFQIAGACYTALFTLELILRLLANGCRRFYCSEDWAWGFLDTFIVLTSLWEAAMDVLQALTSQDGTSSVGAISGLKAFRIIRITRIFKTVRLMRIFRFVMALRMLITSIFHTLKSLFWALVLLFLIVYVFAVLFVQAVSDYKLDAGNAEFTAEELAAAETYYGSLLSTMIGLFMSIAGGVSWENMLLPLKTVSGVWVTFFLFYVAFTYFAVLNVVTAVFCQSAIESAQNDQFTVVQSILANKEKHLQKVSELFKRLGANNATITFQMLEEQINSDAGAVLINYNNNTGLDIWDAWTFFKLLDADGGGEVEVEEFLMGCLRLRGPATAIDMGKVIKDQNWLISTQGKFAAHVEGELRQMKELLSRMAR
ncbi:unnamed protein product [Effrenium voratum]|uniref:EF-hand domain-containing protein n=1 Tax=Effrenium voratum TaxID=2562239 RepID=A0AA36JGF1_9DINO|nr:unnamed protein product [Effrenium voratum]